MKSAYIENVIIWMVMFIGFAITFFFIIDYGTVTRVQDNIKGLSDYGANYVSINGSTVTNDLVDGLNNLKLDKINTITAGNISCGATPTGSSNYQVIFTTTTGNVTLEFYTGTLEGKRVVYNEQGAADIQCTLNITLN